MVCSKWTADRAGLVGRGLSAARVVGVWLCAGVWQGWCGVADGMCVCGVCVCDGGDNAEEIVWQRLRTLHMRQLGSLVIGIDRGLIRQQQQGCRCHVFSFCVVVGGWPCLFVEHT